MKKIALVFCADKKFKKGLNLLNYTLEKHNPFLKNIEKILLTDDIKNYKNFKLINCSNVKINTHVERFKKTFYKLKVFSLKNYDRLIFIDSDVICLGDISFLFKNDLDSYDICLAKDDGILLNNGVFNTGLMVINKSFLLRSNYKNMMNLAEKKIFKDFLKDENGYGSDQSIINCYLNKNNFNIKTLDIKYNVLKRIFFHHPDVWDKIEKEIKLLHFVGNKPWSIDKEIEYYVLNSRWIKLYKSFIL